MGDIASINLVSLLKSNYVNTIDLSKDFDTLIPFNVTQALLYIVV